MGQTASLLAKDTPSLPHHSPTGSKSRPMTIFLELWTSLTNCRPVKQRFGLTTDRISVVLVCFDGFPLCQHQDPTEENLPLGLWGRWEAQPLTSPQSPNGKGRMPLALTQMVLLVLVLIYDCLFNRSSFKGVTLPMRHPKLSIFLVSAWLARVVLYLNKKVMNSGNNSTS